MIKCIYRECVLKNIWNTSGYNERPMAHDISQFAVFTSLCTCGAMKRKGNSIFCVGPIFLFWIYFWTPRFFYVHLFICYIRMWKSCKSLIFLLNRWFVCMCLFKVKTSDLLTLKSLSKRIRIERILLKKRYTIKGQVEMQKNCQWSLPHSCVIMD